MGWLKKLGKKIQNNIDHLTGKYHADKANELAKQANQTAEQAYQDSLKNIASLEANNNSWYNNSVSNLDRWMDNYRNYADSVYGQGITNAANQQRANEAAINANASRNGMQMSGQHTADVLNANANWNKALSALQGQRYRTNADLQGTYLDNLSNLQTQNVQNQNDIINARNNLSLSNAQNQIDQLTAKAQSYANKAQSRANTLSSIVSGIAGVATGGLGLGGLIGKATAPLIGKGVSAGLGNAINGFLGYNAPQQQTSNSYSSLFAQPVNSSYDDMIFRLNNNYNWR